MSRTTEALTALLIAVNARYKAHAGIRLTSLPERCGSERGRDVVHPHGRHRRREARARASPTSSARSGSAAIVNTGDDIEIYGAHVSPDPDLVSFWLADAIDERGWGLRGDTLRGDGCAARARRRGLVQPRRPRPRVVPGARADARRGARATAALARLNEALGVRAQVLPMSDDPVRTWVRTGSAGWRAFQEFMIREQRFRDARGTRVPRRRAGACERRGARRDRAARARS